MFETTVVESKKRSWRAGSLAILPVSVGLHLATIGGAIVTTAWAVDFPTLAPSQLVLYTLANPLPPMPPPPPPPARSRAVTTEPVKVPVRAEELAPTMIPDEIPEVLPTSILTVADLLEGDPGAVEGIEGGVLGGIVGGTTGGVLGGVIGGDPPEMLRAEYDIARPRFVSQMFPQYPEAARWRGIEGMVVVDYIIGKDGNVKDVIVLEEAHPLLAKAAVAAIRRWRFRTTIVNGEPVEVIHKLSIVFALE